MAKILEVRIKVDDSTSDRELAEIGETLQDQLPNGELDYVMEGIDVLDVTFEIKKVQ